VGFLKSRHGSRKAAFLTPRHSKREAAFQTTRHKSPSTPSVLRNALPEAVVWPRLTAMLAG